MTVPTIRARNYSVCAAISVEGVLSYEIRDRAYNRRSFMNFLEDLITKLESQNKGKYVFIMDNATIHRVCEVRTLIESKRYVCEFLPPYSVF
jgi:transposase